MYPGSLFEWYDKSYRRNPTSAVISDAPLFMTAMPADKGTEDLIEIYGDAFNAMYGTMNFDKYGQVSIQAQNIIDAGGKLFIKRLVADDSELANIIITATVTSVQKTVQRRDDNGYLLYYTDETKTATTTDVTAFPVMDPVYIDADGNETTTVTDTAKNIASIKWEAQSVEGATTSFDKAVETVKSSASDLAGDNTFVLFAIYDNGRGASSKAIRFIPDYTMARGVGEMLYDFTVLDKNAVVESVKCSIDPTLVYDKTPYRMDEHNGVQVKGAASKSEFDRFVEAIADIAMVDVDEVKSLDLINGATVKGSVVDYIVIDAESVDLNAGTGVALANGSNGAFGDSPMATEESKAAMYKAMVELYNGTFTNKIYDVDQHKVAMILDAAFPNEVKAAIGDLVAFRKDCMFFRDIGTGARTFSEIFERINNLPEIPNVDDAAFATVTNDKSTTNEKFFANYITSYEIIDPGTRNYVEVTMLYDMARVLVDHLRLAPNAPFAGTYNGFVLESAVEGTLNFTPINTPSVNQKQAIEDLRANYAIFEDNGVQQCVVQSLYTCQNADSQLDYVNAVIAIEYVMRVVRTSCPRNRFSLSDSKSLNNYASAVTKVLEKYQSMFDVLRFEYVQNDLESAQKLFAATIEFAFLPWAQTERFALYAINND